MPRIDLEHVAKFKEVLNLNKISPSRGLFVTTGYYGPRAITIGIKTINGSELRTWEERAMWVARLRRLVWAGCAVGAGWLAYTTYGPMHRWKDVDRALARFETDARRQVDKWKRTAREYWPW
ncbi:uncharacterized protein ACA1_057930 [Acanthamoeba castellanii str. Neff]|uniref:Transmembrane protein n=1 Tax=Acanthamoeba castellanii (strain ATCC 30010 / Neff) TaxID=1257118 RepID=L8GW51_ACACF|nr:uncharacterized protein ACA1_057930 [Acanthamoeba castellanii str. Neff]ELR17137.1 hypothetical protein ACA1_057930 [Acanthamoeba castellanii str. Neff]